MAARNSGIPDDGVYFVNPAASACVAASLIYCGVSKSGSPAPKPQTSTPSALSFFAFASMARVNDGVRSVARCASCCMNDLSGADSPIRNFRMVSSKFAVVKLLDKRLQIIVTRADDLHFALGVIGRIAGVRGIDHDVLAEFATNGARRRLARVRGAEDAADFGHRVRAFIHDRQDLFHAALRLGGTRAIFRLPPRHEFHDQAELLLGKQPPHNFAEGVLSLRVESESELLLQRQSRPLARNVLELLAKNREDGSDRKSVV